MAAGHDIYALKDGTIPAQRQMLVDTVIAIGLPRGTDGGLAARSAMASRHGIAAGGGVIDADYTGEVQVISQNHGNTIYQFKAGDRIAQLIVEKIQTHCYGGSNILRTSAYTRPRSFEIWRIRVGRPKILR